MHAHHHTVNYRRINGDAQKRLAFRRAPNHPLVPVYLSRLLSTASILPSFPPDPFPRSTKQLHIYAYQYMRSGPSGSNDNPRGYRICQDFTPGFNLCEGFISVVVTVVVGNTGNNTYVTLSSSPLNTTLVPIIARNG